MPRIKTVVNLPQQESITREIKSEYGAYLSKNQLRKYLCVGKSRTDVFDKIPTYQITPGRICYRAVDVAAYLATVSSGAGTIY